MTTGDVSVREQSEAQRKHLRYVKRRVLWVLIAYGLGTSLAWYYYPQLITLFLAPADGLLSATGRPIFTGPSDMFMIKVSLSMKGGMVLALPVLVYHIARFVSPVLNRQQRRYTIIILPTALLSYLVGASFSYIVVLPVSIKFLLSFSAGVADPMIHIREYLDLVLALLLWLGVVFEMPIIMFLLARLRLVSHQRFLYLSRYSVAFAFIIGALITPTFDIATQTLVAVPLLVLYHIGIVLAWLARPRRARVRTPEEARR